MIAEALFKYMFDRRFLVQAIASLGTYLTLRLATSIVIRSRRYKVFEYYGIPGPEPRLLDGNLNLFMNNNLFKASEELSKKHGKVYGYYIGDQPVMVITDLEMLRKIFFEDMKYFKMRTRVFVENSLTKGILFAQYSRWKLMRKVMSGPFSQYTIRGESSTQFIETSIKLMLNYIDKKLHEAKASGCDANIDIHSLMKSTALHLISNLAVNLPNVKVQEEEEHAKSFDNYLGMMDKSIVRFAIRFPFIKPIIQFLENHFEHNTVLALVHRGIHENIDQTIARLSTSDLDPKEQANIMKTLIKLHHEGVLTRDEIIGNAESLLIAGYDTTSTTLAYLIWIIAKYPDVQEKLRHELMAHGVDSKYLVQVINETMRLYPTVVTFTTRLATESLKVDEWVIPQGTQVTYNTWLIHHNPEIWPEPYKFDPERFREGSTIHPCAFGPFGLGERKCIGYQLAMLELKMVLCDLLLRYRFKLKSPENLELVSYAFSLTKPKDKVLVEMEKLSE